MLKIEQNGVYQVCNGTFYHRDTKKEVIQWLETSREREQRIRIFYGSNGKAWNEEFDIIGHVGRSTGEVKIPLLIKNIRSIGGGTILDHCIVRIDTKGNNGKIITVYLDNTVKFDHFISTDIGTVYNESKDELYARCKNSDSGKRLADFMNGKRWSK
jgi:hypothetical protein